MTRVLTALVVIPLTLIVTWYAPLWGFALFAAALAAVCFDELLAMGAARGGRPPRGIVALGAAVTASFLWPIEDAFLALIAALLLAMTILAFVSPLEKCGGRIAVAAFGLVYCCALPGILILLAGVEPYGRAAIVTLYAVVWAGDAAAYYAGRAWGRHPLAPRISPKKTVEGALGGLAAGIAGGVAVGHWLRVDAGPGTFGLAIICLAAAGAGQIGDLAESALKRSAGVKDSSAILPGHGGMLDRLDSLLFAAPVFYWFFRA
jgi:phosphatidate cytidylyltransferase